MKSKNFLQKHTAALCIFTLVFGNISPFITFADGGPKVETIKNYKYSENQNEVGSGIVVKNFSDTQNNGERKENFDKAIETDFKTHDDVVIDLTSNEEFDVKVYGFTLGNSANADTLYFVGAENSSDLKSKIESIEFGKNLTEYNNIFDVDTNFLSVKINFLDKKIVELIDLVNFSDLEATTQAELLSLIGDSKNYVPSYDTSYIDKIFSTDDLKVVPLSIDYVADNNTVILGEVFKVNEESKYEYVRTGGDTLDTENEFVIKNLSDTRPKGSEETKDTFATNIDLSTLNYGANENILYDVSNTGAIVVYGAVVGGGTENKVYFDSVDSIESLVNSIKSIQFTKDYSPLYKGIFNDKEFLSVKVNFSNSGSLEFIDLLATDVLDESVASTILAIAGSNGNYGVEITEPTMISGIVGVLSNIIDFVPKGMINTDKEVILGVVYDVETLTLKTFEIWEYKGTKGEYDYSTWEISPKEIYNVIVSKYNSETDNKYDLEGLRKSDQIIMMPAFYNIEGELWIENMTVSSSAYANDVLVLDKVYEDVETVVGEFKSIRVIEGKIPTFYTFIITLSDDNGNGKIVLENAIRKTLFDASSIVIGDDGYLEEPYITALIDDLYGTTIMTEQMYLSQANLDVKHSPAASVDTVEIKFEVLDNSVANDGTVTIYEDEDLSIPKGNSVDINSTMTGATIGGLDSGTPYFYELILSNKFNQFVGTGSFKTTLYETKDIVEDKYNGKADFHSFDTLTVETGDTYVIKVSEFNETNDNKNDLEGFRKSDQRIQLPQLSQIRGNLIIENFTISSNSENASSRFSNDVLIFDSGIDGTGAILSNIKSIKVIDGQGSYKTLDVTLSNSGVITLKNVIHSQHINPLSSLIDENNEFTSDGREFLINDLYNKTLFTNDAFDAQDILKVEHEVTNVTESGATINTQYTGVIHSGSLTLYDESKTQTGATISIDGSKLSEEFTGLEKATTYHYEFVLENVLNMNSFTGSFLTNACESSQHLEEGVCEDNTKYEVIANGSRIKNWIEIEEGVFGRSEWNVSCDANYVPVGDICMFDNVQYPYENLVPFKGTANLYNFSTGSVLAGTTYGLRFSNFNVNGDNKYDLDGFRKSDQRVLMPNLSSIEGTLVLENITISTGDFANDVLVLNDDISGTGAIDTLKGMITKVEVTTGSGSYKTFDVTMSHGGVLRFTNAIHKQHMTAFDSMMEGAELNKTGRDLLIDMLFEKTFVTKDFWNKYKDLSFTHSVDPLIVSANMTLATTGFSNSGGIFVYSDNYITQIGHLEIDSSTTWAVVAGLTAEKKYYYEIVMDNVFNRFSVKGDFETTFYETDNLAPFKGSGAIHDKTGFSLGKPDVKAIKIADFDYTAGNKSDLTGYRKSDQTILLPDLDNIDGLLIIENLTISAGFYANDVLVLDSAVTNTGELFNEFGEISVENGAGVYKTLIAPVGDHGTIKFENVINGKQLEDFYTNNLIVNSKFTETGKRMLIDMLFNKTFVTQEYWNNHIDLNILNHNVSDISNSGATVNASFSGVIQSGSLALYEDAGFNTQTGTTVVVDNSFTNSSFENLMNNKPYYYRFVIGNTFNQKIATGNFTTNVCASDEHLEESICVNNTQIENILNGTRTRHWNIDLGKWGEWIVSCDDQYRPVGDICVFNGGGNIIDNLKEYKGQARTHSYTGATVYDGDFYTVILSDFNIAGDNKYDLEGFRKSDQRILMPNLNNIQGTFVLENMTISTGNFANDVLVLDSSISNTGALYNAIKDIEVTSGSGSYKTFDITLSNSGTIRLPNVIHSQHLAQFDSSDIVDNKFTEIGRAKLIAMLFNKTIVTLDFWNSEKDLGLNHNVSNISQSGATINATIVGKVNNGSLALYEDELFTTQTGATINVDSSFTSNTFDDLVSGSGYYYRLVIENTFNQEVGTGSFTPSICPAGEHEEGGICKSDVETVTIANGTKTRTWTNGAWGEWVVSCNSGFRPLGDSCVIVRGSGGGYSGSDQVENLINTPIKKPETSTGTTSTGSTSTGTTSTGTITEVPPVTFTFATNSKYFPTYLPGEKRTPSDLNNTYKFNGEALDYVRGIQYGVGQNYNAFAGLTSNPEFAFYANKFLYGYEEILKGLSVIDRGEQNERLLANADMQMTQGVAIYNKALDDLHTLIFSKYSGVEEIKIGNTVAQKLLVFGNDNLVGKLLESRVDEMLEGRLTESNLVEVMEIRNKTMIQISAEIEDALNKGLTIDDLMKMFDFGDLLSDEPVELPLPSKTEQDLPSRRDDEDKDSNEETLNPNKKNLIIDLIHELFTDDTERQQHLSNLDLYSKAEAEKFMGELIKIKMERK